MDKMGRKLEEKYETFESLNDVADEWVEKAWKKYQRSCKRNGELFQIPSQYVNIDEEDDTIFCLTNIRGVLARFRVKKGTDEVIWA